MYSLGLIIVQIDGERNHDKKSVYVQGTYSLLYSVVYNTITDFNSSTFDNFKEIALTCFTQIDFKEELVTTIALLHVGTTLASGALIIDKND